MSQDLTICNDAPGSDENSGDDEDDDDGDNNDPGEEDDDDGDNDHEEDDDDGDNDPKDEAEDDDGGGKKSGDDESHSPGMRRTLRHLRGAVDNNFFDDDSDDDDEQMIVRKYNSSPVRRGRPMSKKFGKKKPAEGASFREIEAYEKERKAHYDLERTSKLNSPNKRPVSDYSGNHHPTLRTMNEVEKNRLSKGHTFQTRKLLLLRTKEEANLRGISIKVEKSDVLRFICWSRDEPEFVVIAYHSLEKGYEVKHALVRDMDTDDTWNGIIPGGKFFVANFNNILLIPHRHHILCFSQ